MSFCGVEYGEASYKGIEFEVLDVQFSGGNRVLTHKYPFTDSHYNENLGDKPFEMKVTGAFHGDDFRDQLRTAQLVWSPNTTLGGLIPAINGATTSLITGDFFEPTQNRTLIMTLRNWSYKFDARKLNWVEFDLDLVEVGQDVFPGIVNAILGLLNLTDGLGTAIRNNSSEFQTTLPEIMIGFEQSQGQINAGARLTGELNVPPPIVPLEDATENVDAVNGFFEAAISSGAGQDFFREAAMIETSGQGSEQSDLFALTGFRFLVEAASSQPISPCGLRDLRDIANSLKCRVDNFEIQNQINCVISDLGALVTSDVTMERKGIFNALVASYELYGDISRANEIIGLSNAVSGSMIDGLVYRP